MARAGWVRQQIVRTPSTLHRPLVMSPLRAASSASSSESELIAGMRSKIQSALEAQEVDIVDAGGDGRHVEIHVVSAAFAGKNAVARQRLVYKVLRRGLAQTHQHGRWQGPGRHAHADLTIRPFPLSLTQAIWEEMQQTVHAVDAMTTQTPEEAGL